MAVTGKGAEGIDLAARAMAWADLVDRRRAGAVSQDADASDDADELVPEPRDP